MRGLGAGAALQADTSLGGAKGILVVSGDVTVENMGFTGARRAFGNGAGIRFMQGRLQVLGCNFWDNEMGLLGSDHPQAELRLQTSVFRAAPRHRGQLHHLLYASTMARLFLLVEPVETCSARSTASTSLCGTTAISPRDSRAASRRDA